MKDFYVEVPVVVKLMIGVKADNAEEAKAKVFGSEISIDINDDKKEFEYLDYEWDIYEKVVQGNVYYGGINEIYIKEES